MYVLCMNDTSVWSVCYISQYNICKILRIFFEILSKSKSYLLVSLIVVSIIPECLDRKATDRNFLDRFIHPSGSWGAIETNMATKCFYEFMPALFRKRGRQHSSLNLFAKNNTFNKTRPSVKLFVKAEAVLACCVFYCNICDLPAHSHDLAFIRAKYHDKYMKFW